jgi:hypothetical protein
MRFFAAILAFTLLLTALPPARAAAYSNSEHAFSLDLPEGWTELTPGETAVAVQANSPDPNLQAFAGFQLSDQALLVISAAEYPTAVYPDPEVPYFSKVTLPRIRQIAAAFTGADPNEFRAATQPVASNLGIGAVRQVTCCFQPPGFVVDYYDPKFDARSHSVAFIGRDRLVVLHFFLRHQDYPTLKRTLDPLALSFRFHARQAVAFDDSIQASNRWAQWGAYTLVAVVLAGAAYLAWYLFKPKPFEF